MPGQRRRMFQPVPATGVSAGDHLTEGEIEPTIARADARPDARPYTREDEPAELRPFEQAQERQGERRQAVLSVRDRTRHVRDVQTDALSLKAAMDRVAEREDNLRESAERARAAGLTAAELNGICALVGLPPGALDDIVSG